MKKSPGLKICFVMLIFSVTLVLSSEFAQAGVYDDFSGKGIDPKLWVDRGPNTGLFSQPGDGYLYFNDASGGQDDRLRSYNQLNGACFVSMEYSNFQAINNQPAGQSKSTCMHLLLGDGTNVVYIYVGKNAGGQFFEADNYQGGTRTDKQYVYLTYNSGWLGIKYNGMLGSEGKVDLMYNYGTGWIILGSYSPNFSKAPWFSIEGADTYGQALSFRVHQVQLRNYKKIFPALLLLLN